MLQHRIRHQFRTQHPPRTQRLAAVVVSRTAAAVGRTAAVVSLTVVAADMKADIKL
jgi:hypothetical protein